MYSKICPAFSGATVDDIIGITVDVSYLQYYVRKNYDVLISRVPARCGTVTGNYAVKVILT